MRYKLLGRSGLRVSELCLGTMTFGKDWGWGSTEDESRAVFDTYVEAGGNFFDTANIYTNGTSEEMLGRFVAPMRERAVVATKYTMSTNKDDPNASGNHRKNMVQSVEASLKRLGTDYIDLYWIHAWDYLTPIDEVMRALDDLVSAGKILYAGISDTPAWVVSRANTLADHQGWTPFVASQLEYSLIERSIEPEYFPMSESLDLAICAWSPLGAGVLTGKYTEAGKTPEGSRLSTSSRKDEILNPHNIAVAKVAHEVAEELAISTVQVALAWMRQRRPNIIPIVGARIASQLEDSMGYINVELSDDQIQRLNSVSNIPQGFPHEFLQRSFCQDIIYGHHANAIAHSRAIGVTKS